MRLIHKAASTFVPQDLRGDVLRRLLGFLLHRVGAKVVPCGDYGRGHALYLAYSFHLQRFDPPIELHNIKRANIACRACRVQGRRLHILRRRLLGSLGLGYHRGGNRLLCFADDWIEYGPSRHY